MFLERLQKEWESALYETEWGLNIVYEKAMGEGGGWQSVCVCACVRACTCACESEDNRKTTGNNQKYKATWQPSETAVFV